MKEDGPTAGRLIYRALAYRWRGVVTSNVQNVYVPSYSRNWSVRSPSP
jgi:hypothetical protein